MADIKGYRAGQQVKATGARVRAKQTTPPARFTDGSLIQSMTEIHRRVKDEAQRKMLMATNGLGTERTRSAILNTLMARKFLVFRKEGKRNLVVSTPAGRELIEAIKVRTPEIADPVMTAKWEYALGMVERGEATMQEFMGRQEKYIRQVVATVLGAGKFSLSGIEGRVARPEAEPLPNHGTPCPLCGKPMITRTSRKVGDKMKQNGDSRFLACSGFPDCKYIEKTG